jgi:hypothetical protein
VTQARKKKNAPLCLNCGVRGHFWTDKECPRREIGVRNPRPDALRLVTCEGCGLVKFGTRHPGTTAGTAAKLLVEALFDVASAKAQVSDFDGSFWDAVRTYLDRVSGDAR